MGRYRLGRKLPYVADERDRQFLMAEITPAPPSDRRYNYFWDGAWWGNQGNTPECVAYSLDHLLADGPVTHKVRPPLPPDTLYGEAQQNDEWDGTDYDGTSVRGGAKALALRNLIGEYRWAFGIAEMRDTILTVSPVVVGVNWYEPFFEPDSHGVISLPDGAKIAGGHAFEVNGVNIDKALFRGKQSWGRDWGVNGHFYIPFEVMDRLLSEDGEALMATENPDAAAV